MIKKDTGVRDYLSALKGRRRVMITVFLGLFLAVTAYTMTERPVYKAVAEVYIDPGMSGQLDMRPETNAMENKLYISTQLSILGSEATARAVVAKLHLDQAASGNAGPRPWPISLFFRQAPQKDAPTMRQEAINSFRKNLKTAETPNSDVVDVSFTAGDPVLAADGVNSAVEALIEKNLDLRAAPAKEAMQWLNGRLEEIKTSMTATANQLQDYKQRKDLLVTGENDVNISLKTLSDLNSKALAAEVGRREAEVRYQRVLALSKEPDGLMSLPEVIDNKLIQDLESQEAALAKQSADLSKRYGDKHPQMIRLRNEMEAMKGQIRHEVSRIMVSIKNDYKDALRVEQSLKSELARQKAEAMDYAKRSSEYEMRKQDVEGAREVYDMMLKKLQESSMLNFNISSVHFIQKALPPLKPYKPNMPMNLAIGLVLAMFSSLGVGILMEYFDRTCKTPEDVEDNLGLPVLGVVPRSGYLAGGPRKGLPAPPKPASVLAGAFRDIKGNILLRADINPKLIQVCSAVHSEGKSTVALNFARSLAAAGERVLLVDADVRRPSLHRHLDLVNTRGLTSLLTSKAVMEEVIFRTRIPNLHFMPSGPAIPELGTLIMSANMCGAINPWRENYDRVVIDSPPYMGPVDAHLISSIADGVVLVILSGKTDTDLVLRTLKNLELLKVNVLGCVLNDALNRAYYYNHRYYGAYGAKAVDA